MVNVMAFFLVFIRFNGQFMNVSISYNHFINIRLIRTSRKNSDLDIILFVRSLAHLFDGKYSSETANSSSNIRGEILLMEEFLHHLGW